MNVEIKHNRNYNIDDFILNVENGVKNALQIVREKAVELEKGRNEKGIISEITKTNKEEVVGKVMAKADKFQTTDGNSYLWFEYYGTGEHAEKPHIGTTKHFHNTNYREWLIPVEICDKPLRFLQIEIGGKLYYLAHGQKANHFLDDAEFTTRQLYQSEIKNAINKYFGGIK